VDGGAGIAIVRTGVVVVSDIFAARYWVAGVIRARFAVIASVRRPRGARAGSAHVLGADAGIHVAGRGVVGHDANIRAPDITHVIGTGVAVVAENCHVVARLALQSQLAFFSDGPVFLTKGRGSVVASERREAREKEQEKALTKGSGHGTGVSLSPLDLVNRTALAVDVLSSSVP
jgi:hypothetical protein